MQHDGIRPDVGGEVDVPRHLQHRHLPSLLVERGELVELGVALRCGKRDGAERVDASDRDLSEPRPEALDLADVRVEAEFQFFEAELQRLVRDGASVIDAPVAPVRGER